MDWIDLFDLITSMVCIGLAFGVGAWLALWGMRRSVNEIAAILNAETLIMSNMNVTLNATNRRLGELCDGLDNLSVDVELASTHASDIRSIVEQMQKDKLSDMQSFSRVMARVLKTYIKDGTKSGEGACWACGVRGSLVYQEKCVACSSCGASKCG